MKTKVALLSAVTICMLSASPTPVFAQSTATKTLPAAKEVLANYVKAIGGEDAYKSLKSVSMKGTLEVVGAGLKGEIKMMVAEGGKSSTTIEIPGVYKRSEGSDGKTYWSESSTVYRIVNGKELVQRQLAADLQAELHADKYFESTKVTGVENVNGEPAYRLERVTKEGSKHVDFFSTKSGLTVKSEVEAEAPEGMVKIASYPSDYRKVGKVLMPFKLEQVVPGGKYVITMKEIKHNETVDASKFELPETVAKMKAKAAK